jgi:hypothetical protein
VDAPDGDDDAPDGDDQRRKTYAFQRGWGVMSKFERLLEAGSTELPDCRCAAEMNLLAIVPRDGGDTEIRIYRCLNCSHELRLTAWRYDPYQPQPS